MPTREPGEFQKLVRTLDMSAIEAPRRAPDADAGDDPAEIDRVPDTERAPFSGG